MPAMQAAIITGIVLLVLLALFGPKAVQKAKAGKGSYRSAGQLLSPAEQAFLRVLEASIDAGHRVFAQVALIEIVVPTTRDYATRNRIDRLRLDFLIVDRETTAPICAVELNDKSHDQPKRRARDAFLTEVMKQAGVPLVFQRARATYSRDELAAAIRAATPPAGSRVEPTIR